MKKEQLLSQTKRELETVGEYKVCSKKSFSAEDKNVKFYYRIFKNNKIVK